MSINYYEDLRSTAFSRQIFSDEYMFGSWIKAKKLIYAFAAMGKCEFDLLEVEEKWLLESFDYNEIRSRYKQIGFPILPFVEALKSISSNRLNDWVQRSNNARYHRYWTSFTGKGYISGGIEDVDIISMLSKLMKKHEKTVMAGRTFQQYASPITFGYKVAIWLVNAGDSNDLRKLKLKFV